ncbi:MAG: acetate--CoA ligase family protein [Syntrophobacteraceae bacterium]
MNRFYQAKSVAVIGVSASQGNMGRAIVYNLLEFRFQGVVYLVGPKGGSFMGHKIYPSVLDIPDPVDLAAVLVPAVAVPQVLRECGEKGIRRVVVESAGFRELAHDRVELENEIRSILASFHMRMIGPNCIGIINRQTGLAVPFMPFKAESPLGRVSIVSQSGGVGAMMINSLAMENLGFSKFASIGNKLDVNEADFEEYLIGDDETDIVYLYLEGIADGRRLMAIAQRSRKPIIVHKSNNGGAGAVIARSHSASLTADDRVVDAAFRQCGILRSREQREGIEMIRGLTLPPVRGNGLAIISRSGGHAVMAADAADDFRFVLPEFPEEITTLVRQKSRAHVIQPHNPLDLGDLFDLSLYRTLADMTLQRDDVDALVFVHNYQGVVDSEESRVLLLSLGELIEKHGKPLALCVFTGIEEFDFIRKTLRFPVFSDPREAVRALALNRDWRKLPPLPFPEERPAGVTMEKARSALEAAPTGMIAPEVLASVLGAYGIALTPWRVVEHSHEALLAAREIGLPVALKTADPDVIHKSDAGGVVLNVKDDASVEKEYGRLTRFGLRVMVQKMAEEGLEWFVGGRQDEVFGPVLVVGLGGLYVEILNETGLRVAPVSREEAARMLDELKGAPLLDGARGRSRLDREALLDVIQRISWILWDFPEIRELDCNPIRVYESGCLALDWRAVKDASVD